MLRIVPMSIWHFWLSISSGIKSQNIDLNSWDKLYTLKLIASLNKHFLNSPDAIHIRIYTLINSTRQLNRPVVKPVCHTSVSWKGGHLLSQKLQEKEQKYGFNNCIIHSVFCLMTGPKPPPKRCLHIVRCRASSFKW